MVRRVKRGMKAVPIIEDEQPDFAETFNSFVGSVAGTHGIDAARSYRCLREREAQYMQQAGVAYTTADSQLEDFLQFRIDGGEI